jgi:23S rRNA (adenine2030-N6)-methyltransferase
VKYRHVFHAGNFADVHKHVTLLALIRALSRKDKGFLLLDTHAGRGLYDLQAEGSRKTAEADRGIALLESASRGDWPTEIRDYLDTLKAIRREQSSRRAYPGSPLIALAAIRPQDRAVFIETQAEEHTALHRLLPRESGRVVAECADGYQRIRHWLPNSERRALVLIDPPYEDTTADFRAVEIAACEVLCRLPNAVVAIWYPIKHERDTQEWRHRLISRLPKPPDEACTPAISSELWIHPPDSRVGLNGSGMLILNPPWQIDEQMAIWLPILREVLDTERTGGAVVRSLQ